MKETRQSDGSRAELYWPSIAFPRSYLGILLSLTCSIVAAVFTGNYAHQQQFIFFASLPFGLTLLMLILAVVHSTFSCLLLKNKRSSKLVKYGVASVEKFKFQNVQQKEISVSSTYRCQGYNII